MGSVYDESLDTQTDKKEPFALAIGLLAVLAVARKGRRTDEVDAYCLHAAANFRPTTANRTPSYSQYWRRKK